MEKMEANVPAHFRFAASDLVLQLVIKLRRPNLDALLLLLDHLGRSHRPLRDDRSDRTQTVLLLLLEHPGRSHRPLRDDRSDRTQTVLLLLLLLRAALSELQRLESLPASPLHLSLSLRPFLAPCACSMSALLQFSSELHCQSCNAQSPPLPSKTLKGTPSLLAVSV
jgi:hypothetical protein